MQNGGYIVHKLSQKLHGELKTTEADGRENVPFNKCLWWHLNYLLFTKYMSKRRQSHAGKDWTYSLELISLYYTSGMRYLNWFWWSPITSPHGQTRGSNCVHSLRVKETVWSKQDDWTKNFSLSWWDMILPWLTLPCKGNSMNNGRFRSGVNSYCEIVVYKLEYKSAEHQQMLIATRSKGQSINATIAEQCP